MSSLTEAPQPADVRSLLTSAQSRGLLIAVSRDPDAKATFIITERPDLVADSRASRLAVKIPRTRAAGIAVEREGRMLVELRRMPLGAIGETIPRYVQSRQFEGRPVLVSTGMPGASMSVAYHQWLHTARPQALRVDFELAGRWLAQFQSASARGLARVTWAAEVADELRGRWDGHPRLAAALSNLEAAQRTLGSCEAPTTAVHGDFWFGNLLVHDGQLVGVVDWESGEPEGSPLRDLARFVLSYCLYLDRHTRPGHRVAGHRGLRRVGCAPGVSYALLANGWLPQLVRSFLGDGLTRLGLSRALWYDVALTGIGEVAALANDLEFGACHLELLAGLPAHPRRYRR